MKNNIKSVTYCILAASAVSTASAVTIISDAFSTDTANTTSNRLRVSNSTDNWVKDSSSPSLWTVASGVASNAGTTAGTASEGGLLRVLDVDNASLADFTELTFSFDYTVGTGSTLYFHAIGLNNGTATSSFQLHNFTVNGNIQSQYDSNGDFSGMNLKDGTSAPDGTAGSTWAIAAGTGTFSQTIDISNYTGIDDINDFQYLTMGWATDMTSFDGTGAVSVDNFSFTATPVPEPSSTALLGLGGLALILRRRK